MIERDGVASFYDIRVRRIEDRVSRIWTCVAAGIASDHVGSYVQKLREWEGCRRNDWRCLLNLGHYTTANLIVYTPDPPDRDIFKSLEVVRREAQEFGRGKGDCGTYTVALDTIFWWWGCRIGCRVIAQSKSYDHVFAIAEIPGLGVVPMDASPKKTPPPGWEPPPTKYWARRDFWLNNASEWIRWWLTSRDNRAMPRI